MGTGREETIAPTAHYTHGFLNFAIRPETVSRVVGFKPRTLSKKRLTLFVKF